ncbi:hypothetical protein AGMMS49950_11040 [Endomicrobiia bacterium]|nr:hypothetical protein AGMMS49950_11040 [Endomicrobiia bacterium]
MQISNRQKRIDENKLDAQAKGATLALIAATKGKIGNNSVRIALIQNKLEEDDKKMAEFEKNRKNIEDTETADILAADGLLKQVTTELADAKTEATQKAENVATVKDQVEDAKKKVVNTRRLAIERRNAAQETFLNELFLAIYYNDDENNRTTQKRQKLFDDRDKHQEKLEDIRCKQADVEKNMIWQWLIDRSLLRLKLKLGKILRKTTYL